MDTTTNEPDQKERRRHRRYAVKAAELQVWWLDQTGKLKVTTTQALDVSEDGMSLQLPEPVMPLRVRFHSERFGVQGVGVVKQCHRAGRMYIVGLEFTEGLHWRAPEGEVVHPIPLCDPESAA